MNKKFCPLFFRFSPFQHSKTYLPAEESFVKPKPTVVSYSLSFLKEKDRSETLFANSRSKKAHHSPFLRENFEFL